MQWSIPKMCCGKYQRQQHVMSRTRSCLFFGILLVFACNMKYHRYRNIETCDTKCRRHKY